MSDAPAWPRLMRRETAAAYCDMTPEQFDRQCQVAPIDQGWRGLRWDKAKLDAWIDSLPSKPRPRHVGVDGEPTPANEPVEQAQPLSPEQRRAAALTRW